MIGFSYGVIFEILVLTPHSPPLPKELLINYCYSWEGKAFDIVDSSIF